MRFRFRRPSPALFVAILALIVAMGGSAIAIQRVQSGDTLIAKRTLSGNRLRLNTVTGAEVTNLQWHNLNLIHGWTNYNDNLRAPAWALDAQGVVHFRGAIHDGASSSFARLPLAARPSAVLYLPTTIEGEPGQIIVGVDGYLNADYFGGVFTPAINFTNLDGVTYALH